jgi:hypothetical protein
MAGPAGPGLYGIAIRRDAGTMSLSKRSDLKYRPDR